MPDRPNVPRVLTATRAAAVGVSYARIRTEVRRGNWQRLTRGVVLTDAHEPTREDWAEAGVLLAGRGSAVSGWDALRYYHLARGAAPDVPVLVLTTAGGIRTVGGVHIRRTRRPFGVRYAPGQRLIRIVPPARAVGDAVLWSDDPAWVRALVTSSVQKRRCDVRDLLRELEDCPRNGSHWFRSALRDAVSGARAVAEADALHRLVQAEVPPFEMNVPVQNEFGEVIFIVDVLWRTLRAVLEIDSREYHLAEADWLRTMAKHNALTRLGFAVMHDAPSALRDPRWGSRIDGWVRRRAGELGLPVPIGGGVLAPAPGEDPPPLVVPGLRRPSPRA